MWRDSPAHLYNKGMSFFREASLEVSSRGVGVEERKRVMSWRGKKSTAREKGVLEGDKSVVVNLNFAAARKKLVGNCWTDYWRGTDQELFRWALPIRQALSLGQSDDTVI